MVSTINRIDNGVSIVYSSAFERYYVGNIETHTYSAEGYKNEGDALDAYKNNKVIWAAGIKNEN
jgi:hypothetical protein